MKRREGFTMIEVMVSLGVMTMGALAIIALQTYAMRANVHARQVTQATQIAQIWIERLKQDSHTWNIEAIRNHATQDVDNVLANTNHLIEIWNTPNEFTTIVNTTTSVSNGFNYFGEDEVVDGSADVTFCASHRLSWVFYGKAMRTDVRVWWRRPDAPDNGDILTEFPACQDNNSKLNPGGTMFSSYNVVYVSSVVRYTALQ